MSLVIQGAEQGKGEIVTLWWRSLETPGNQVTEGNTPAMLWGVTHPLIGCDRKSSRPGCCGSVD